MKKIGKVLISLNADALLFSNCAYAATETANEGFPTKYVFMGVAVVVIVLLLFLGYKMDTKGNEMFIPRAAKKASKKDIKREKKQEIAYDADAEITYEEDDVEDGDLTESMEYAEDDDESLFNTVASEEDEISISDEESENFGFSTANTPAPSKEEPISKEVEETITTEPIVEDTDIVYNEEDEGEEFDTSIIDGIDDEDSTLLSTSKVSDETMIFNNMEEESSVFIADNLEKEIDDLDDVSDIELISKEDDDFINELKSFKEPESDFEGFSVAEPEKEEVIEEVKKIKKIKKYIKVKKEEVVEEPVDKFDEVEESNNFLAQMEANLEKDKVDRDAKNNATKKSHKNNMLN